MEKVAKAQNYTAEQTAELVSKYKAKMSVEDIAAATGRSVRAVISKLVAEKVYVSPNASKTAKVTMTKNDLVCKIAEQLGRPVELVESLEKATKPALEAVLTALETASVEADRLSGDTDMDFNDENAFNGV